jgi:hypothetical protein
MKRIFSLCCVLAIISLSAGCNQSDNVKLNTVVSTPQTQAQNQKKLKDSIAELVVQKNVNLKIKRQDGNYYKATQYFTVRVIEMLKRFSPINQVENHQKTYDLKLSFEGYKDICMNSQTSLFWFEGESQIYGIDFWSDYWNRYIMKEINGEIIYSSFERDIIEQNSYMDVDKDGKYDDFLLYYDGDIRLKVKDSDVPVLLGASQDAVSSIVPSNQYNCNLYIKEDTVNNRYQLLVGITYSFTNKYGSTSWLSCYEYKNRTLEKTWWSDNELHQEIKAADYKNGILTVNISGQRNPKKIILNDEQKEAMQKYKEYLEGKNERFNWQDITFVSYIMPQYEFYDYDNDGEDELITYSIVQGGPPSLCLGDVHYSVYEFTSDGITLKDSFFASYNNALNKVFF